MRNNNASKLFILALAVISFAACQKSADFLPESLESNENASLKSSKMNKGFVHGLVVKIDGMDGAFDVDDGGPGAPNPPYEHYVTPGVDLAFPNNGFKPYP